MITFSLLNFSIQHFVLSNTKLSTTAENAYSLNKKGRYIQTIRGKSRYTLYLDKYSFVVEINLISPSRDYF